jgi:hypothetical protein
MAKREYVRFYHKDWASSGDVQDMTMEEVGVYWTLLVRQMVDGSVTTDRNKLKRLFNVDTVEEVERLLTEKVMSKFVPVEGDPSKLHNKRLSDVIQETDAAIQRGVLNAAKRWDPLPITTESIDPPALTEEGGFDFTPILNEYPRKKRNKGGWNKGIQMMRDYITTEDEYQLLHAAVKNYAKKKAGEEERFIKNLDNFLQVWREWVPANFTPTKKAVPANEAAPPSEEGEKKLKKRDPKEKPPWEPDGFRTQEMNEYVASKWPEERRQRWLAGEDC